MLVLAHESVHKLNLSSADFVIKDNFCYLDDCYVDGENDRQSLSMWKHRIKAED